MQSAHSPTMSTRRRRSSGYSTASFTRPIHSRKSSMHSLNSPHTPYRPSSALDRSGDYGFGMDTAVPEGLDNLAAELAEEDWDEEEEMIGDELEQIDSKLSNQGMVSSPDSNSIPESRNGFTSKHEQYRDRKENRYDSEEDDIDEKDIISPDLEHQMNLVEQLSKQDTRENNKDINVFQRVEVQLQDLSSQLQVEDQATRLANTASLISTHLMHEERYLRIILQTHLSPFAAPPAPEVVEALQPMIAELISSIPAPPTTALPAIQTLASSGTEILSSLAALGDNLYIAQQNTSLATQRLRSAQDIVHTIRREIRQAEEGLHFLQVGGWEEKLQRREAAAVCSEVVGGFEAVCESWRRRLSAVPG